ncbi:hypothetical protein [Bacillus spizizenii]|uniref:hypothetical protein n=1 Tax=Bacillus spizizenii TaxID=96241 RepID=UPI00031724A2|nr:hypothetical protein [Bacillus spizizenii]
MKKITLLLSLCLGFLILSANPVGAKENKESINAKSLSEIEDELVEKGVESEHIHNLAKKLKKGEKLDADKYLESDESKGVEIASQENPNQRIEFGDGSFIENSIEDITEEENKNVFRPLGIEQIGGMNEHRILKISNTAAWGYESFKVEIDFPLIGYAKILRAYDWYYLGAVSSVDYRGIYRASETASRDAVAMQKLQIGISGISYLAKLEFRIKDGRYWTVYKA